CARIGAGTTSLDYW
nr:immunoglobulin heavy chain junction region [Macaca mulatta]MOY24150.1 immunoglobulin heavy chain junction region [Macaca mulatta]MOY24472.1 immunoglobulin heavy chain junction region [Macaca mulatta]MOY29364.1 immunoglobulin heavy chain junction region [Macaca mulatta]MOY30609.1 immunoglobulin heavy chain junction region [Macaca mulatta]